MRLSYKWEVKLAIKQGSIRYFLHKKMPLPSQEYDIISYYPFGWCVWAFDFDIWLGTFCFEFSSEFRIFVNLLFTYDVTLYLDSPSLCHCAFENFVFLFFLIFCDKAGSQLTIHKRISVYVGYVFCVSLLHICLF